MCWLVWLLCGVIQDYGGVVSRRGRSHRQRRRPALGGALFSRVFEPDPATIQIKNHLVYSSRRAVYRPYKLTVFTV